MIAVKRGYVVSARHNSILAVQVRRLIVSATLVIALLILQNDVLAFNCNAANNKVEKIICSDSAILELDRILQLRYKEAMASADVAAEIRTAQHKWLATRNACNDKACIDTVYRDRNAELEKLSIQSRSWMTPNTYTRNLCRGIAAELANSHVHVLFSTATPSPAPVSIDVNGDGIEETVYVEETSINVEQNKAQSASNYVPTERDYDSTTFAGEQSSLIREGDAVYLLHSNAGLPSLYYYGPQLEEHLLCVFNQSRGYAALSPYEILQGMTSKDPLQFAIEHLDIAAVKILLEHGHSLNKKPDNDAGSYLDFAVSQVVMFSANHPGIHNNELGRKIIEELFNLGGVSGSIEQRIKFNMPLAQALRFKRADIADLLLARDGLVYRTATSDVLESFKDKSNRDNLLLKIAKRRGDIDDTTVSYAVQPGNVDFLRALVATGLPLHGFYVIWFNGKNVDLIDPLMNGNVQMLDNKKEVLALLQKLHKKPQEKGQEVGFRFVYETDNKVVLMTTISGVAYSAEREQELVNFSTSVCMHLIGGECGSPAMQDRAGKWLEALPITCPQEFSRKFDTPTCKLAMHWVSIKEFPIFMKNKRSPEEYVNGSIPAIKAFTDLGTRSLRSFFGRILAH